MSDHVFVDPDALVAAASELDALAARLQATLAAATPALTVAPAGSEEVSALTATYFARLADSVAPAAARGVAELAAAADTLRAQATAYRDGDHAVGAALTRDV